MALIQTHSGSAATATPFTIVQANTTSGNTIIVGVSVLAQTVSSITDSQSNTYVLATSITANSQDIEIWYAKNIIGGTTPTITVNLGAAATATGIAREYSGLDTIAPLDKVAAAAGVGGATASSGATATTTQASELVIGAVGSSAGTSTVGSGYGNFIANNAQTAAESGMEDKTVAATGAQTATFGTSAVIWSAAVATFKTAASTADTINVSDSTTTSESIKLLVESNINKSDSTTLTENVVLTDTNNINVSDLNTPTESIKLLNEENIKVSDATTLTENITEFITTLLISPIDIIGTGESVSLLATNFININDSTVLSETVQTTLATGVSVSDNIGTSESIRLLVESNISTSDITSVSESITLFENLLFISVNDSTSLTENVVPQLAGGQVITVSDIINTSENVKLLTTNFISQSDSVVIGESVNLLVNSFISKSDSTTLSENIKLTLEKLVTVSDTTGTSESVTVFEPLYGINIRDTISINESVLVYPAISFIDTESLTLIIDPIALTLSIPDIIEFKAIIG